MGVRCLERDILGIRGEREILGVMGLNREGEEEGEGYSG